MIQSRWAFSRSSAMSETVSATDAARDLNVRLKTRYGSLIFMQSGGCCDGSSPMCLPKGDLLLGPNDLLLGGIEECPVYIDREQYERWRRPAFVRRLAGRWGHLFAGGSRGDALHGPRGGGIRRACHDQRFILTGLKGSLAMKMKRS